MRQIAFGKLVFLMLESYSKSSHVDMQFTCQGHCQNKTCQLDQNCRRQDLDLVASSSTCTSA